MFFCYAFYITMVGRNTNGVMANVLDSGLKVSEFGHQGLYYYARLEKLLNTQIILTMD